MDLSTAIEFFNNPKWAPYKDFVDDYKDFMKDYYKENPDKSVESAIDFFVELMTALSFEQERADFQEKEKTLWAKK